MAVSLRNKVVLITGASSGFGKDAAHLFAQEGAKVILAARRLDRLQMALVASTGLKPSNPTATSKPRSRST